MSEFVIWDKIENFLSAGGYTTVFDSPTAEQVAQYVDYFKTQLEGAIDPVLNRSYAMALNALTECVKDRYPNPHLRLAFTADNVCCGVLFYYEVADSTPPFLWSEMVVGFDQDGAVPLLEYLMGNYAGSKGWGIGGTPSDAPIGSRFNVDAVKDPTTKWTIIPIEQIINVVVTQKQYAINKPNFYKIFEQSLVWAEPVTPAP
jgi:hypothetical protein